MGIKKLARIFFFNCYLSVPLLTLGYSQRESLTNSMLITAFVHIPPEGHQKPCNEVGSLSPAERPAGFEPGTFRFLLQRLNPLGHSPPIKLTKMEGRGGAAIYLLFMYLAIFIHSTWPSSNWFYKLAPFF